MKPDEFWKLTPNETWLWVGACAERELDQMKVALSAAWHGAVFSRMKTVPPLDQLLARLDGKHIDEPVIKEPPPLTGEAMEHWLEENPEHRDEPKPITEYRRRKEK